VRTRARRLALALGGGLALFAAHPPLDLGWLGLVAVAPLAALAREVGRGSRPLRTGFGWGFLAGLAFFGPLVEWIRFIGEWVAWPLLATSQALAVGAFVAGLAWWGEHGDAAGWRGRLTGAWWRPVMVAAWWVALELVRSHVPLGGFPWGVLGYTQAGGGPVLDVARTFGVLGVSAWCAAIGACVEEAVHRARTALAGGPPADGSASEGSGFRAKMMFDAAGVPLGAVLVLLVTAVLVGGDPPEPTGQVVDVGAVQGFDGVVSPAPGSTRALSTAEGMLETTARMVADGGVPDVTVWPESAIDADADRVPELAQALRAALVLLDGGPLLTGMVADGPRPGTSFNQLTRFSGDDLEAEATYVKRRPVPFGEYVPYRPYLEWFPPLRRTPVDRLPGDEAVAMAAGPARFGALICYDIAYPSMVRDAVTDGADVLVVVTNNSSYGVSAMSDQHIAFSRLRAVETGRHVVHAALTGVSALVDPEGRVTQRTDPFQQAVVRAELPLVEDTTPAQVLGELAGWLAAAIVVIGTLLRLAGQQAADRHPATSRPCNQPGGS
jgi:apolipoprotein N-acyltransferase